MSDCKKWDYIGWRNFKTDPPYNWTTAVDAHMESDPDVGFILYRYTHRPWLMGDAVFVSPYPYAFKNGAFEGYRSHMVTSKYEEDWIEVLAWIPLDGITALLLSSGRAFLNE